MSEAALAPRAHARARWLSGLLWGGAAAMAALAAVLGAAPALVLLLPLLLACLLAALGEARLFLWLLAATSGLGVGWGNAEALAVAGRTINVSGLRWGLIVLAAGLLLVRLPARRLPLPLRIYGLFVALAAAGILWAPDPFEGFKNTLQLAAPLLIAAVAVRAVETPEHIEELLRALWVGLLLGVGAALLVGLARGYAWELRGGLQIVPRTLGTFLLPFMALALAGWRHRSPAYAVAALVLLLVALPTLSRATILTMVLMAPLAMIHGPARWKVGGLAAAALILTLASLYAPLRERVLPEGASFRPDAIEISGRGRDAELQAGGLQLSGRGLLWLRVYQHAEERPLVGHGTGSATVLLASQPWGILHPHNDYIRAFHDQGLAGLALVLAFGASVLGWCRRAHREARGALSAWLSLAAGLALFAYLLTAVADNVMLYVTFFTQNVFLLLALAARARQMEEDAAPAPAEAALTAGT